MLNGKTVTDLGSVTVSASVPREQTSSESFLGDQSLAFSPQTSADVIRTQLMDVLPGSKRYYVLKQALAASQLSHSINDVVEGQLAAMEVNLHQSAEEARYNGGRQQPRVGAIPDDTAQRMGRLQLAAAFVGPGAMISMGYSMRANPGDVRAAEQGLAFGASLQDAMGAHYAYRSVAGSLQSSGEAIELTSGTVSLPEQFFKEARPIGYAEFLNHVNSNGLKGAFTKPLDYVYDHVYAVNKAFRPDPETYLSEEFMATHSEKFAAGAARVDSTASFNARYLRDIEAGLPFGRPDAVFTSPAPLIDSLYATGSPAVMEDALGFPLGTFNGAGSMTRTYISNPGALGLRFARGSEGGANPYWMPGGYTFNVAGGAGLPEMVTDQLPSPLVNTNVRVLQ